MSNHLAIATVSAALGRLLQGALDQDVPGARVSHDRPGGPNDDQRRGVNIFLFQATPNAALRNLDLPQRNAGGGFVSRPTAALDLHYLLTFYGDAPSFEPERVLGSVARRLHEQPVLDRALITATVEDAQNLPVIGESDLASAPELVRFAPTPLNLEELSKLWSILFQTAYRLSSAYRGTVVQIEAREEVPGALPVRRRSVFVVPIAAASVDSVRSADGIGHPILPGGRIVVAGRGFDLPGAALTLNGIVAAPDQATVTRNRLELDLTPAALGGAVPPAGLVAVRLRLPPPQGAPAHLARETPAFPFMLQPRLTLPADPVDAGPADPDGRHDGSVTIMLDPPLAEGQTARLLLDRTAPRPPIAAVLAPDIGEDAAFPLGELAFPFSALRPGTWLVRVQVDGAESPLELETDPADPDFGTVIGPTVSIP
jgi:Pvc16 N-terminal domain